MRIDKFLWSVRIYKTRAIAAEAIKKNRVLINNVVAKSSKEVMVTDVIQVKKQGVTYTYEVLQIPKSRLGAKLKTLYIKDKTPQEELEKLKSIQETQSFYRFKGVGRPTKKDRRDLDGFIEEGEE